MRPVLPIDISNAARALLSVPHEMRQGFAARLVRNAAMADRYRKRFGRAHADWGNGTLMAAARMWPLAPEPRSDNQAFLECQFMVFDAVLALKSR